MNRCSVGWSNKRSDGRSVGRTSLGRTVGRCAHPKSSLPHRIAARPKISTPSSNHCAHPKSPSLIDSLRALKISLSRIAARSQKLASLTESLRGSKFPLPHPIAACNQSFHCFTKSLRAPKISTPSPNRCSHSKSPLSHPFVVRTQNLNSVIETLRALKISILSPNRCPHPKSPLAHRIAARI